MLDMRAAQQNADQRGEDAPAHLLQGQLWRRPGPRLRGGAFVSAAEPEILIEMAGSPSMVWRDEFPRDEPQSRAEIGPDGWPIGNDPRRLSQNEPRALEHEPMSAAAAIRAHCRDCWGGFAYRVRK
jgi:hypothetical protein